MALSIIKIFGHQKRLFNRSLIAMFLFATTCGSVFGEEYLVSVKRFGAIADAHKTSSGVWFGTDNAKAINDCAAYCRKNGLTMFFPKGNYGVASTIWLTNPEKDGLKQASIAVLGSNKGAYFEQNTSVNICVLASFKAGKLISVPKWKGPNQNEPDLAPVIAISNGRQVSITGIGIQGNNKTDLICGLAIGNTSQLVSVRNCSLFNTYAGIVFPGLRPESDKSIVDGNNDLLVVEESTFDNAYNIVCAGSQPFACNYRNNAFHCSRSAFTGTLITSYYGYTEGSHKFSSNLFGTGHENPQQDSVYFDLSYNNVTIDSCCFETAVERELPEILVRVAPLGSKYRNDQFSFTNNIVNFVFVNKNPSKYRPIIDTLAGNRMIFQGNLFKIGTATRIKADGAIFIGNAFCLYGSHNLKIENEIQSLLGKPGNVLKGRYDFNHFIRLDSPVVISLPDGTRLSDVNDYKVIISENCFEITQEGKAKIDKARASQLKISYQANDADKIRFSSWGASSFMPPNGWQSRNLTMLANKLLGKDGQGQLIEKDMVFE
jgi:hypothetical protein